MGILRNIGIAVFAISFLTFVALFGQLPALRRTPIGWLQRLLCLHTPNGLKALDRLTTGGRITTKSKRLGHYLFYEKNPVVLVSCLARDIRVDGHTEIYVDTLPNPSHWKRSPVSPVRHFKIANTTDHSDTVSACSAVCFHVALRPFSNALHYNSKPP